MSKYGSRIFLAASIIATYGFALMLGCNLLGVQELRGWPAVAVTFLIIIPAVILMMQLLVRSKEMIDGRSQNWGGVIFMWALFAFGFLAVKVLAKILCN
ncbi:hypothetical protein GALL_265770 [mine drainage metagenome]|uniref:Uncharacterized protein n=1 Tax=mine drainage metagenome TaxID=410659 RepID=A0A1J5RHB3_9ZZZZ